jgi:hypothetical protein
MNKLSRQVIAIYHLYQSMRDVKLKTDVIIKQNIISDT